MSSLKLMLSYLDQEIENMDNTIMEVKKDEERCKVEEFGTFARESRAWSKQVDRASMDDPTAC